MRLALIIALGSALGGLLRYLVALGWRGQVIGGLPIATLTVNIVGSAIFGLLAATYSSFNGEMLRMLVDGHAWRAIAYAGVTGTSCLLGGGLGWWLGALK